MKIRTTIALAFVFSAGVFGFLSNLQKAESAVNFNSKCAIASFQTAYSQSKAVFAGEVVGEDKDGDTRTFDFKVEKYWKGSDAAKVEILVYETARYQAWFKKGGKYLIYATADEDGKLHVGRCSRSRDLENAEEDLQKLGKGKIPR
ncbi:MAG TPA: hypothetical protein VNB22_03065 [Pyrinomonadaceae bacterium]|jgi:hypothetical protein|nr:hypothetical protein [Pyrinomonadaceae bacterium]